MSSLYFIKKGQGPNLVFLHNGGGFHEIWNKQIDYFSSKFTCYAVDLMGFGKSPIPTEEPTLNYHEKCLEEFLQSQELSRYHLVGNCIGASIALFHSQKHPERVETLTLFNICPGIRIYRTPLGRFVHKNFILSSSFKDFFSHKLVKAMGGARERRRLPSLLFGKNPDSTSKLFLKFKDIYQTEKQKKARLGLLHNIETFTTDMFIDKNKPLPPTLLFWGDHNKVVDLKEGARLKELIKPNYFCVLNEAGHMAMYEKPDEVNSRMNSFLTKHFS